MSNTKHARTNRPATFSIALFGVDGKEEHSGHLCLCRLTDSVGRIRWQLIGYN